MKIPISLFFVTVALSACGGGSALEGDASSGAGLRDQALTATTPAQRQTAQSFVSLDGSTNVPFLEYLPADYATSTKTYPLLMFLHGGSGAGASNGSEISKLLNYPIPSMIAAGNEMCFSTAASSSECFIVVSPQSPRTTGVWNLNDTAGMLRYALNTYRVDPKRVYVTGVSMGGGGTWSLMAGSYTYGGQTIRAATQIAAAIPIATGAKSTTSNTGICAGIVSSNVAIWAFHNSGDPIAALANEQGWVNKVNLTSTADGYSCSRAANPAANLTIYPANGHEGWTTTYNVNTQITSGMNAFQWLLSHQKP